MKLFVALGFLISGFASTVFAHNGDVPAFELRGLINSCRADANEARCLRRGLRNLIQVYKNGNGGSNPTNLAFTCMEKRGRYAAYNNNTQQFVDVFYAKTLQQCNDSVNAVRSNLMCVALGNNNYGLRNTETLVNLGHDSRISFQDCMSTARSMTERQVCVGGPNGLFARFNLKRDKFVDPNYDKTLSNCIARLR